MAFRKAAAALVRAVFDIWVENTVIKRVFLDVPVVAGWQGVGIDQVVDKCGT